MEINQALEVSSKILALNLIFNGIELWQIRNFFQHLKQYPFLKLLFIFKVLLAGILLFKMHLSLYILLIAVQFFQFSILNGTFSGGAEHVTNLVLFTHIIANIFSPASKITKGILIYVTLQIILSYFIPGILKLRNQSWRNGTALKNIFLGSSYNISSSVVSFFEKYNLYLPMALAVTILELIFPAIIFSKYPLIFIVGALIFHLFNFFTLGLNRFVFSWAQTYPIILYTLTILPSTN